MSTPRKPLVTIDDDITRIERRCVLLMTVERVDRDGFYADGNSILLRHEDEGVTWLRGHFLLHSKEVEAAQAAQALGDRSSEVREQKSSVSVSNLSRKSLAELAAAQQARRDRREHTATDPRDWRLLIGAKSR